jgi:hypothetical protein
MTARTQTRELDHDAIEAVLAAHPEGLIVNDVARHFPAIPRESIASALHRLVVRGVCVAGRTVKGGRSVRLFRHVPVAVRRRTKMEAHNERLAPWVSPPFINPIRARVVGAPVADTERMREVRSRWEAA